MAGQYSIDLRTNNGVFARLASWFTGGRLVTPDKGRINGPSSAFGRVGDYNISDTRAMQISAVWACVRIITNVVSSLPIELYRDSDEGKKPLESTHPLYLLVKRRPNRYMTSHDFRKAMNLQLALFGNAYALKTRNASGDVISVIPLQAPNVSVVLDDEGELWYVVERETGLEKYRSEDIFHLKGIGTSGLVGLSPIANSSRTLGVTIAMEDQQGDFYANGAKTPKILTTGEILSKQQREQLRENFQTIAEGPVRDRLWILEAGFDTRDVQISPADAQTLESRNFQVAEIARIWGIPPHLIGDVEKSTSWGSGIEQQNQAFIQYTLMEYFKSWESAIKLSLINDEVVDDRQIDVQHNADVLLRGDSKARSAFLKQMTSGGIYTINEARARENLPPVDGGDEIRIQVQNQPINEAPPESGASS
ncbi:hypothetical protein R84981_000974 [Carnimonas sp. R-84981]|uniref:phage portal protein n=1 Tax=Carnimonas bestiolae TaxID=3402172 RepID=UPI003EDBDA28